jgi:hypothetical protein
MNFMHQRFNTLFVQFWIELIANSYVSVCYCNFCDSAEAITSPHKPCQKVTNNYFDRLSTPVVRIIMWFCVTIANRRAARNNTITSHNCLSYCQC